VRSHFLKPLFVLVFAGILYGCSYSDSQSDGPMQTPSTTPTFNVSGEVSVGKPISGSDVKAYMTDGFGHVNSAPIAEAVTAVDGSFTLNIPTSVSNDPIIVETSGGTYVDPYTSAISPLPINMHSIFTKNSHAIAITPVTEAMYQYARYGLVDGLTTGNITKAQLAASNYLYGIDPVQTLPVDFSSDSAMMIASPTIAGYSAALGIMLKYSDTHKYASLNTLTAWVTPAGHNTCHVKPYTTKTYAIPTSFFANICTPGHLGVSQSYGYLSDPKSLYYNSALTYLRSIFNFSGASSIDELQSQQVGTSAKSVTQVSFNAEAVVSS